MEERSNAKTTVIVAIIGALGAIAAALIPIFLSDRSPPAPTTVTVALQPAATAPAKPDLPQDDGFRTTGTGLRYRDERVGAGAEAGKEVTVHYTGWLYFDGQKGKKFDNSLERGKPITFRVGEGRVIKGWEEGVSTMRVGGKRTLIVPPALAYGPRGSGAAIPPNTTLMFDLDLIGTE